MMEDKQIEKMFINVKEVKRFEWDAYPKLDNKPFPKFKLDKHIYYLNAFENALSTMETEILYARNVVRLIKKDLGIGNEIFHKSPPHLDPPSIDEL
jgi:prenylcysteine oxidase/farnesylcysteine lyase